MAIRAFRGKAQIFLSLVWQRHAWSIARCSTAWTNEVLTCSALRVQAQWLLARIKALNMQAPSPLIWFLAKIKALNMQAPSPLIWLVARIKALNMQAPIPLIWLLARIQALNMQAPSFLIKDKSVCDSVWQSSAYSANTAQAFATAFGRAVRG